MIMKEKIKLIIWNKVKGTYPMGTSKHTNAILEDDFEKLTDELFSLILSDVIDDLEVKTKRMESVVNDSYNEDAKGGTKTIFEQFYSWLNEKRGNI